VATQGSQQHTITLNHHSYNYFLVVSTILKGLHSRNFKQDKVLHCVKVYVVPTPYAAK